MILGGFEYLKSNQYTNIPEMNILINLRKQFQFYHQLGLQAITQLGHVDQANWKANSESNSVSILTNHLYGNMKSRFTDFLITDGEKSWRNRDQEFEGEFKSLEELIQLYNDGWNTVFATLESLEESDLRRVVYIRNQGHSVFEAINRQITHYAYHVGQIVYLCKLILSTDFQSLSIPKGQSEQFNRKKFDSEPSDQHYTEEWIEEK